MLKIIGIFAIVFVYYCEINAELDNLQYWKTPADVRRILSSKNKFASNKSGGIGDRSNLVQSHTKFTTGFREDIKDPYKEYILRNGEVRNNDLEHHMVKKRRFKRNNRDEENQIVEQDNEREKPKKKKRQHHHSKRKKNKNHNSTSDMETKNNDTMINVMEENYNEDEKKHHHHSGRKINTTSNLTRNKKKQRYKNKDRNLPKNKNKKHSEKRYRDKNHIKYSELLKNISMSYKREKDHINKKKKGKDKSKDKQRDKSMDRIKHAATWVPMTTSNMSMLSLTNKNDHKNNEKQELNKNTDIQKEKSKHTIDTSKTAIGIAGLGAAGVAALVGKSMASIKDPKLQSEEVLTSTTTPKPEPVQEREVVNLINLVKRERTKIRVTRIIPFSLNRQDYDEGIEQLRQKSEGNEKKEQPSAGTPPSNLSPYAIMAQMELLMKEFPNVNATITKVARTVEYNDIVLVRITEKKEAETYFRVKETKYVDDVPEKKIIFIVHGLTVMGLRDMTSLVKISELKLLLSYYFNHLDKFDFFLMPLANPDGYSASLSTRPIWNKNVSPQSVCPGVFVDRNFDVAWKNTKEVSSCSQLYPGAIPFSEEESKAIRDVLHRFSHKIMAYIHVHAGTFDERVFKGDAILYPRGYIETQSDDDKYIDIKGEVDEAMKNASFRVITATVDTLSNWYGVVSGTSVDYAATVFGIPYAMEFVMQLYDSESLNNDALTQIWSRLIDATFNKMWKSLQGGSDARKFIY